MDNPSNFDDYIEEKLDQSEKYFNQALLYSRGQLTPPPNETHQSMVRACIGAGMSQIKKIEYHIIQSGTQAKEDGQYHKIIK